MYKHAKIKLIYPDVIFRKYGSPVKVSEYDDGDNLDAEQDEAPVQQNASNSALKTVKMETVKLIKSWYNAQEQRLHDMTWHDIE